MKPTRRRARRFAIAVLLLVAVVGLSSCHLTIGCTTYRLFEPTATSGLTIDQSACNVTPPPPVLPEAPMAILLPLVGAAAVGSVVVVRRRRRGPG